MARHKKYIEKYKKHLRQLRKKSINCKFQQSLDSFSLQSANVSKTEKFPSRKKVNIVLIQNNIKTIEEDRCQQEPHSSNNDHIEKINEIGRTNSSSTTIEINKTDDGNSIVIIGRSSSVQIATNKKVMISDYVERQINNTKSTDNSDIIVHLGSHQVTIKSEENDEKEFAKQFKRAIANWAVETKSSYRNVTSLLSVLHTFVPQFEWPKNAKSLLKTPRRCYDIIDMPPGNYIHFGIARGIESYLQEVHEIPTSVELIVGTDSLPIAKSNSNQLWPILGSIFPFGKVFLIGCYFGDAKPASANDFLHCFVEDVKVLTRNGFCYNGKIISFKLFCLVCNASAMSFITMTKVNNGYFSCPKCKTKGEYCNNRLCFPDINYDERCDEEFRCKIISISDDDNIEMRDDHYISRSILCDISNFDLVSQIPFDYMHLLLGVVPKLLRLWLTGPIKNRILYPAQAASVSTYMFSIRKYIPQEFARKPRNIKDYKRWKATEFRLFLLYIGVPALMVIFPENNNIMSNFLTLHVANRLLCCSNADEDVKYADSLMRYFVQCFIILYGKCYVSYEIHGLMHLAKDVENFGVPLDFFSAFKFENYLHHLKVLLRKSERPLSQIHNRIIEILHNFQSVTKENESDVVKQSRQHCNGPLTKNCKDPQFSKIIKNNLTFTNCVPDNCCQIDMDFIMIENFAYSNAEKLYVIGRKYVTVQNLYDTPCDSSTVGVYKVRTLSHLQSWPVSSIKNKCMRLPLQGKEKTFATFLYLHSDVNQ